MTVLSRRFHVQVSRGGGDDSGQMEVTDGPVVSDTDTHPHLAHVMAHFRVDQLWCLRRLMTQLHRRHL